MRVITYTVALALLLGAPQVANAAKMLATYKGVIAVGSMDDIGVFGPAGTLTGDYTATFRYDTALGSPFGSPGVTNGRVGGTLYGVATPILDATFTVNGITDHFSGMDVAQVLTTPGVSFFIRAGKNPSYIYNNILGPAPANITTPTSFSGVWQPSFIQQFDSLDNRRYFADLQPNFFSLSAVPEPATWALLLVGFFALGSAIRAQRGMASRRTALAAT